MQKHSQGVAGAIRAEMARSRTTQTTIARTLGITQQSVSRRLTGEVAFDVDELHAVADLLGVPVADLLGGTDAVRSAS